MNPISENLFSGKRILIIGDVMLDAYIWGKVDRISPEAPVPIVAVEKRENRLGGAANVALNIQSLGSTAVLATVIGNDDKSDVFTDLLRANGMPVHGLMHEPSRKTTTKFRIIGNNVQMLRVDEETDSMLSPEIENAFLKHVTNLMEHESYSAVIFEDYDKGVISPGIIAQVTKLANEKSIPVLVDPKKRNFMFYPGVTVFKPNLKELREAMNVDLPEKVSELAAQCEAFRKQQNITYLLLTLGERGMLLTYSDAEKAKWIHIPSQVRNVADVSGAGDTVVAVAALALAAGASAHQMATWSNMAAGIVCEFVGVVPVEKDRFISLLQHHADHA